MRRVAGIAAVVAGLLGSGMLQAEGLIFSGLTAGYSPQFNRPGEGSPPAGGGPSVRFQAQSFQLPSTATCTVEQQQDFDGFIHLYGGSFNPASPLTNVIAGDDDDPEIGTRGSKIPARSLAAGTYVVVSSSYSGATGNFQTTIRCNGVQPITAPCNGFTFTGIPAANTSCLLERFMVAVDSVSGPAPGGLGTPIRMGTSDTALFWFYNSANIELAVKAIDGCGLNSRKWIFASASTDQQYRLIVADTFFPGLAPKTYFHGIGTPAPALTDTNAYATCP